MTTRSPSIARGLISVYGDVLAPGNLKASLHLLLNFAVGVVAFIAVTTLLSLTVAFLLVFPLALVTAWLLWVITVGLGAVERARIQVLLGFEIPSPSRPTTDEGVVSRVRGWITDGATWRALLYLVLLLPVGILTFTVTLVVWTTPLGLVIGSIQAAALPAVGISSQWLLPLIAGLVGIALIAFIPFPIRALAELNRAMGRGLLGTSQTKVLEDQVTHLTSSRTRVAETAEDDRRRIERDLHDGVQQRLVALAMNLGMAKERLASDMEGVGELVEEAHIQTKRALAELRDLARGIHPAILAERGLEAALTPLAALSPVPVSLSVRVEERPSPEVEIVAYFVVSEALTNIAKHSQATRAAVTIERDDALLVVEVTDDGRGGADSHGAGLTGLRNRVEGIDGWFSVTSPDGGPTTIMAELPCE